MGEIGWKERGEERVGSERQGIGHALGLEC